MKVGKKVMLTEKELGLMKAELMVVRWVDLTVEMSAEQSEARTAVLKAT